jgi:hypothetical protein
MVVFSFDGDLGLSYDELMRALAPGLLLAAIFVVPSWAAVCSDPAALATARAAIEDGCDCAAATNHGAYVRCAAGVVRGLVLPSGCDGAAISCAARSTCGRSGAVACCRTTSAGTTKCSIKRSGDRCRAPAGGSACHGPIPSCCDACRQASCVVDESTTTTTDTTTTTTTTLPPCTQDPAAGCCVGDFDSQPGSTPPGTCAYEVVGPECSVRIFLGDCAARGSGFTWYDSRCPDPLCGEAIGCCRDAHFINGADLGTFGTPLDPETAAQGTAACESSSVGGTAVAGRCP